MAAGLGPVPSSTSRVHEAPGRAAAGVLTALEDSGEPVTVATLAEALGQHPNTVREHLDALVEAGLAERTRAASAGRGRPAWLYAALPAVAAGSREYAGLATALALQLARTSAHPGDEAATAGRAWGASLATASGRQPRTRPGVERGVMGILDELGFEPESRGRSTTVRLRRCPLLEAAREEPEVVCSVHLGIVRGAMDTWGADTEGVGLVPFAEPGACLLHLATPKGTA